MSNQNHNILTAATEMVWTTWEELLLASAVKRHGVKDWEAITVELRNRSTPNSSSFLTPQICEGKFHDLHRRYLKFTENGLEDDVISGGDDVSVPLFEELRKMRVAELREEVQRYDLSIESLQIRVQRLEDERSKSCEPENNGVNRSDLEKNNNNNPNSNNLNSVKEEAENNKKYGCKDEKQSVNSSSRETGAEPEPVCEDSSSHDSKTGAGDKVEVVNKTEIMRRESFGESQPFISFLDFIRSHKHGSVFERRLHSQKTDKYKNMIRQHVDLRLVYARIDDGAYSTCPNKFYLDLLLIFNNAIVFFPQSSPESRAANSLRTLVMEELKKLDNTTEHIYELQPKPELERSDSLLVKHRSTSPTVVACKKRSSIGLKPSSNAKLADNKPLLNLKLPANSSSSALNEDDGSIALKLKEKPVTGARSVRRGSKSRPNNSPAHSSLSRNENTSSGSHQAGSAMKDRDTKSADKKKTELSIAAKKRSAAEFLKRIKKTSPTKGSSIEALIGSEEDSEGSKSDQVKKKVERKKVARPLRSGNGGGRRSKGDRSPSKKNVGRPPKKIKDVTPPPKRRRDVEGEGLLKRLVKRSRR